MYTTTTQLADARRQALTAEAVRYRQGREFRQARAATHPRQPLWRAVARPPRVARHQPCVTP